MNNRSMAMLLIFEPRFMMHSLLYILKNVFVSWEIPDISSRWRWLERAAIVGFAAVFPVLFVVSLPGIFLGFGLFDEFSWAQIIGFIHDWRVRYPTLFPFAIGALIVHVVYRNIVFWLGHWRLPTNDTRLPLKTLLTIVLANGLNIAFVVITLWILNRVLPINTDAVTYLGQWALTQAQRVPTLFELPTGLALLVVYQLHGLVHYWLHRLCHTSRFLWLVLHQFHHMPPVLTGLTTTVVINAVPVFLLLVIPKVFIFAALSKLVHAQPLFAEIFMLHCVLWLSEPYGHQTMLYADGVRSRIIRALSAVGGNGVYHYLHHASVPLPHQNTVNPTNAINIGGGLFYLWDRVFGTYHPLVDEPPPVGLWGQPPLHHNPCRILLAGVLQLIYEWRHNTNWSVRVRCLLGSVGYRPKHSKCYVHRS